MELNKPDLCLVKGRRFVEWLKEAADEAINSVEREKFSTENDYIEAVSVIRAHCTVTALIFVSLIYSPDETGRLAKELEDYKEALKQQKEDGPDHATTEVS